MTHECELGVVVRLQVVFDIRIYYLLHSYEIQGNLSKPNLPRNDFCVRNRQEFGEHG